MQTSTTIAHYKPPTGTAARLLLNPLSRLVHGNAAGYHNNAEAQRILRECQRQSASTLRQTAIGSSSKQLNREGYLALQPAYDRSILEAIRRRSAACFDDPSAYVAVGRYAIKPQHIVSHPERRVPELRALITDEIAGIVEGYFRSHFRVEIIRLWRNYPVPSEQSGADHYSNLWHNDYDLATRLRFFVLLTDHVTPETGAMAVFPIAQTKRIMRNGYMRRDAIYGRARTMVGDESRMVFFTGNLGSACFMNPQLCLHRASVPKAGSFRDIVQFTLVPSPSPMPPDWAERLPDDPEIPSPALNR